MMILPVILLLAKGEYARLNSYLLLFVDVTYDMFIFGNFNSQIHKDMMKEAAPVHQGKLSVELVNTVVVIVQLYAVIGPLNKRAMIAIGSRYRVEDMRMVHVLHLLMI